MEQLISLIDKTKIELKKRDLFAIFDRDGTLVPINIDPQAATMSSFTKNLIKELAAIKNTRVGILSARSIKHLAGDLDQCDLVLAGNYGLEIVLPDKRNFVHPIAKASRSLLLEAKQKIENDLPEDVQVVLEDHGLSLCLHWQMTAPEHREIVHNLINEVKKSFPNVLLRTLPTSYEIWPTIVWNKAFALDQIKEMLQLDCNHWLVIYAGDSEADESAFEWVNENNGISIHIGSPCESKAQYQLLSTRDLEEFISTLIDIKQNIELPSA